MVCSLTFAPCGVIPWSILRGPERWSPVLSEPLRLRTVFPLLNCSNIPFLCSYQSALLPWKSTGGFGQSLVLLPQSLKTGVPLFPCSSSVNIAFSGHSQMSSLFLELYSREEKTEALQHHLVQSGPNKEPRSSMPPHDIRWFCLDTRHVAVLKTCGTRKRVSWWCPEHKPQEENVSTVDRQPRPKWGGGGGGALRGFRRENRPVGWIQGLGRMQSKGKPNVEG